jgi:hypothetical protein
MGSISRPADAQTPVNRRCNARIAIHAGSARPAATALRAHSQRFGLVVVEAIEQFGR